MARVKFERFQVDGVVALNIVDWGDSFMLMFVYANGGTSNKVFKKSQRLRVEFKGSMGRLISSNCATIFGNIKKAYVGNSAEIEGYVRQFQNPRDSVTIDRNIKIAYRDEDRGGTSSIKARIIHIDGNIQQLFVNVSNVEMEVVLNGNCDSVSVGNCLYCKGTVENIRAGNSIYCTMGKSNGKTKRELQKEKNRRQTFGMIKKKEAYLYEKP